MFSLIEKFNIEKDNKYLWLYEDFREKLMWYVFALVLVVFFGVLIIRKIKNRKMPKIVKQKIGTRKFVLSISIYLLVFAVSIFFYLFQVWGKLDITTMGFRLWLIKYFELFLLMILVIAVNTVLIIKTNWYSKEL